MKYTERLFQHSILISLVISAVYIIILYFLQINTFQNRQNILFLSLILTAYFIFSIFLFRLIPQETLNVDRFSVITSFWDSYFNWEYVYFAKSFHGNLPGPMPFYFILALPFYLVDP